MSQKIFTLLFFLCVFGLLVLNRFDVRSKTTVTVLRDTGSTYVIGHTFKQGEIVRTTNGEFVELLIDSVGTVALDENTNLELKSLSKNEPRVRFGHGRILVHVESGDSFRVDTPTAQNILITGSEATFIGYDFNRMTSVIPIVGIIKTTIPLLNQSFDVASPINIHDINPPTIKNMVFDKKTNNRKAFYEWAENN